MTREEHRRAAEQLAAILDRGPRAALSNEDEELVQELRHHHKRQSATYGTCMDCGLAVTLPDPDRGGPECAACGGGTVAIDTA